MQEAPERPERVERRVTPERTAVEPLPAAVQPMEPVTDDPPAIRIQPAPPQMEPEHTRVVPPPRQEPSPPRPVERERTADAPAIWRAEPTTPPPIQSVREARPAPQPAPAPRPVPPTDPSSAPALRAMVESPSDAAPVSHYDRHGYPNPDAFNWSGFALGGHVGTAGVGVDAVLYLARWANLRLVTDYVSFLYKATTRNVDFDYDWESLGAKLLLDLYPGPRRQFRFSAGLAVQDANIDVTGEPRGIVRVGGSRFAPAEAGRLSGTARFDNVAPYFGIGFGNAVRPDALVAASFDLGVLLQDYRYTLRSTGPMAGNAAAMRELQGKNEDVLDWFRVYPVVSLGLTVHF